MDDRSLPELDGEPPESPRRQQSRRLHDTLVHWFEVAPGRVVNRHEPMASNGSKPCQAQLIMRHGLRTPETLITNEPAEVLAFRSRHGRIVYKSISGVRSIVQELTDDDLPRLDLIQACPTQFQAFVPGRNVRVHTVGGRVFAIAIDTDTTDYRYAARDGDAAELSAIELPPALAQRCLDLAADLGLAFAGIDLKITPDWEVYCLEVNPSPAYSYYQSHTGQPIAAAVADYLAGRIS